MPSDLRLRCLIQLNAQHARVEYTAAAQSVSGNAKEHVHMRACVNVNSIARMHVFAWVFVCASALLGSAFLCFTNGH